MQKKLTLTMVFCACLGIFSSLNASHHQPRILFDIGGEDEESSPSTPSAEVSSSSATPASQWVVDFDVFRRSRLPAIEFPDNGASLAEKYARLFEEAGQPLCNALVQYYVLVTEFDRAHPFWANTLTKLEEHDAESMMNNPSAIARALYFFAENFDSQNYMEELADIANSVVSLEEESMLIKLLMAVHKIQKDRFKDLPDHLEEKMYLLFFDVVRLELRASNGVYPSKVMSHMGFFNLLANTNNPDTRATQNLSQIFCANFTQDALMQHMSGALLRNENHPSIRLNPLGINDVVVFSWLVEHNQIHRLEDFGFDNQGRGTLSRQGLFELLKLLGYLKEEVRN